MLCLKLGGKKKKRQVPNTCQRHAFGFNFIYYVESALIGSTRSQGPVPVNLHNKKVQTKHNGKANLHTCGKLTTNQGALFEMLSFSLVQCIFTYSRSQYIFGEGLLEVRQSFSLLFLVK